MHERFAVLPLQMSMGRSTFLRVIVWSKVSRRIRKDTVSLIFSRLLLMLVPRAVQWWSYDELRGWYVYSDRSPNWVLENLQLHAEVWYSTIVVNALSLFTLHGSASGAWWFNVRRHRSPNELVASKLILQGCHSTLIRKLHSTYKLWRHSSHKSSTLWHRVSYGTDAGNSYASMPGSGYLDKHMMRISYWFQGFQDVV
jgi:hypothetical protein